MMSNYPVWHKIERTDKKEYSIYFYSHLLQWENTRWKSDVRWKRCGLGLVFPPWFVANGREESVHDPDSFRKTQEYARRPGATEESGSNPEAGRSYVFVPRSK